MKNLRLHLNGAAAQLPPPVPAPRRPPWQQPARRATRKACNWEDRGSWEDEKLRSWVTEKIEEAEKLRSWVTEEIEEAEKQRSWVTEKILRELRKVKTHNWTHGCWSKTELMFCDCSLYIKSNLVSKVQSCTPLKMSDLASWSNK